MQYNITTVNFAIDGNSAEGEIYTGATHTFSAGNREVDVVVGGRYVDNTRSETTHGSSSSGRS